MQEITLDHPVTKGKAALFHSIAIMQSTAEHIKEYFNIESKEIDALYLEIKKHTDKIDGKNNE